MATLISVAYPTRSDPVPFPWSETRIWSEFKTPGDNYTESFSGSSTIQFSTSRSGYKVVGFQEAIRAGTQAGSPYSRTGARLIAFESGRVIFGNKYYVDPQQPGKQVSNLTGWGYPPYIPNDYTGVSADDGIRTDNHALVRFYSAIRAEVEHWNSLVFLGELREIVAQVRRPYAELQYQIEDHLNRYRRAALRKRFPRVMRRAEKIQRLSRLASAIWLETAFATAPTLSDVATAAETLARFLDERRRSRVKGFAERSGKALPHVIQSVHPSGFHFNTVIGMEERLKVIYIAGLDVSVLGDKVSAKRLAELAGVDWRNLPVTLYELVPYSWLADYVTTAGACLSSSLTMTSGVRWAIRSESRKTRCSTRNELDPGSTRARFPTTFHYLVGSHFGTGVTERTSSSRALLDTANLPQPFVQTRRISDYLPEQGANVLALLVNRANSVSKEVRKFHRI